MRIAILIGFVLMLSVLAGIGLFLYSTISYTDASNQYLDPRIHRELPQNPPQYVNTINISTTSAFTPFSTDVTSFDTNDSINDVLCFYNQQLTMGGWHEVPTELRKLPKSEALDCPSEYDYIQRTAPPEWCNAWNRYVFRISYSSDGDVLHVRTDFVHEGNGLR